MDLLLSRREREEEMGLCSMTTSSSSIALPRPLLSEAEGVWPRWWWWWEGLDSEVLRTFSTCLLALRYAFCSTWTMSDACVMVGRVGRVGRG